MTATTEKLDDKAAMRLRCRRLRESIADFEPLLRQVRKSLSQKSISSLGIYWPIGSEPDLRPLAADWASAAPGRRLALPCVEKKAGGFAMVFRSWTPGDVLARDAARIHAPTEEKRLMVPDLVFAPCVGFSRDCRRLGFGGGFFDRCIAGFDGRARRPAFWGVAPAACEVPASIFDDWDRRLDAVVTEKGLILP